MDISKLEAELARTVKTVDSWAAHQVECAQDLRERYVNSVKDQTGKLQSLQNTQQQLQRDVTALQQRLVSEQHEVSNLQFTSASVRAEQDALRRQLSALQEALRAQEVEYLKREADVSTKEKERASVTEALQRKLKLYANNLGLELRKGPDHLLLVFTQIDAQQPSREYKLAVRVQSDNTYKVTRCEPPLARVKHLLRELNSSLDFAQFVIAVRKEFQAIASAEHC